MSVIKSEERKYSINKTVVWFYDNSIRLWTAYIQNDIGDKISKEASYSVDKYTAICSAVDEINWKE